MKMYIIKPNQESPIEKALKNSFLLIVPARGNWLKYQYY
jgi:hypothetical protein